MSKTNINISKNFSKVAQTYENYATVQKYSSQKLVKYCQEHLNPNPKILDLGCGTGYIAKHFSKKNIQTFSCDLSLEMLTRNAFCDKKINCDFENLPFKKESFDVLISSFSLQWIQNFQKSFAEFYEILKPNGIICFCLPAQDSFNEIRKINPNILNDLKDFEFYRNLLKKNNFNEIFCKKETLHEYFRNPIQALKSFKNFGANYKYQKNIDTANNLFSLRDYKTADNSFSVSWEVGYFIFNKD